MNSAEFVGVFYFTNWTDEDYVHLWNNQEYTFPKKSMVPLIMPKETSEAIQEIRKRFAYDLAVREFYSGKEYQRLVKLGNKAGGIPPIFDEKILEPMIEKCLNPLPLAKAQVRNVERDEESKFKGSKAVGLDDNLNETFKKESASPKTLGKMPEISIN